jgi:hypothetical protein
VAADEFTSGEGAAGPGETFPDVQQMPSGRPTQVEYLRVFSYVFESPHWLTTILIGGLCYFAQQLLPVIGIVGPLLFLGYQFEVTEALLRNKGASYPEFDFDRFSDYLMRGLWPLLVYLAIAVMTIIPVSIVCLGMFGAAAAVSGAVDKDVAPLVVVAVMLMCFLITMIIGVVVSLFATPMMLRAGLMQQFGEAFKFGWAKDFVGRTWKEMILFWLFMMVAYLVLAPLGLVMFCVGIFAVAALFTMANGHIYYQLYALYLARGGEPIPLDPPIK